MRINFTGRQTEVTPDLRQFTQERLRKISRLLQDRFDLHVILSAEKHRRTAELTLTFRDHTLVGIEETEDERASIVGALSKLERQAVRFLERRRTQKRRPKPTSAIRLKVLGARRAERENHHVVETEKIPIKPLTIEEAMDDRDLRRLGVVVFRNSKTDRVNVLCRRHDGKLSLIEPES